MVSKQEQRRNRVEKFIQLNLDQPKSSVVKRFIAFGVLKRTIYSIIKRLEDGIPMKRQVESGLKPKIFNRKKQFALKTYYNHYNHNDKRSYTAAKNIHPNIIQRSMLGVRKTPRKCYLHGVYAVCHSC